MTATFGGKARMVRRRNTRSIGGGTIGRPIPRKKRPIRIAGSPRRFRKGESGKFLWPGFGDNMRVLKWIIDRCEGSDGVMKSPIGFLPGIHDLDLAELEIDHNCVDELLEIDHEDWKKELAGHKKFFDSLGGVVPEELLKQCEQLAARFQQ